MSIVTQLATASARRWRRTLIGLTVLVITGLAALTVGLDREGFPPINTPISIVSGTYFVAAPARVDTAVLAAIEPDLAAVDGVVETSTRALPNAFVAIVEFESSISSEEGTTALRSLDLSLPDAAIIEFTAIDDAKFAGEFDLFVSVVDDGADPATLQARAAELAAWLEADDEIATYAVQARKAGMTVVIVSSD